VTLLSASAVTSKAGAVQVVMKAKVPSARIEYAQNTNLASNLLSQQLSTPVIASRVEVGQVSDDDDSSNSGSSSGGSNILIPVVAAVSIIGLAAAIFGVTFWYRRARKNIQAEARTKMRNEQCKSKSSITTILPTSVLPAPDTQRSLDPMRRKIKAIGKDKPAEPSKTSALPPVSTSALPPVSSFNSSTTGRTRGNRNAFRSVELDSSGLNELPHEPFREKELVDQVAENIWSQLASSVEGPDIHDGPEVMQAMTEAETKMFDMRELSSWLGSRQGVSLTEFQAALRDRLVAHERELETRGKKYQTRVQVTTDVRSKLPVTRKADAPSESRAALANTTIRIPEETVKIQPLHECTSGPMNHFHSMAAHRTLILGQLHLEASEPKRMGSAVAKVEPVQAPRIRRRSTNESDVQPMPKLDDDHWHSHPI
jgi:hypothetical protein